MPESAVPIAVPSRMARRLIGRIWLNFLGLVTAFAVQASAVMASGEATLRTFTGKDGTSWSGHIIGLSDDGAGLIIRDLDDRETVISIIDLDLDGQQLIKDWQAVQSGEANGSVGLSATVITDEKPAQPFREGQASFLHKTSSRVYKLYLSNAGSLPTTTMSVEYCLLYWNKVAVYPIKDGAGTAWSAYSGKGRIHYYFDTARVTPIAKGSEKNLLTRELSLDRLIADGKSGDLGRDQPIGIRVRLVDPFGNVVAEHCDFPPAFAKLSWTALSVSRRRVKADDGFRYLERGVLQVDHSAYDE